MIFIVGFIYFYFYIFKGSCFDSSMFSQPLATGECIAVDLDSIMHDFNILCFQRTTLDKVIFFHECSHDLRDELFSLLPAELSNTITPYNNHINRASFPPSSFGITTNGDSSISAITSDGFNKPTNKPPQLHQSNSKNMLSENNQLSLTSNKEITTDDLALAQSRKITAGSKSSPNSEISASTQTTTNSDKQYKSVTYMLPLINRVPGPSDINASLEKELRSTFDSDDAIGRSRTSPVDKSDKEKAIEKQTYTEQNRIYLSLKYLGWKCHYNVNDRKHSHIQRTLYFTPNSTDKLMANRIEVKQSTLIDVFDYYLFVYVLFICL